MEKIKRKPIETVKTVIISILTISMLALAAIYIGGSQFASRNAAINASPMPLGAVAVGEKTPEQVSVYEKNLLAISFIGIHFGENSGGSYATEQAAHDLLEFAMEPLHVLLSSASTIKEVDEKQFTSVLDEERYICMSLVSPLPYQIIYALSGEYTAPAGSNTAITPEMLLLAFDSYGKTSLYMREGDKYYVSLSDYTTRPSELLAMASDSRLYDFEVVNGIPLSESTPLVQTLSLTNQVTPDVNEINALLGLFDYDKAETQPMAMSDTYTAVAPHGTLTIDSGRIVYTAAKEGGISMSAFLENSKSELDMDTEDVLLASVSLTENLRGALAEVLGNNLDLYLDGFYRKDDIYTVIFGVLESSIPISGDGFPYIVKITAQSGRFKSIELNFISAEKSGYAFSPFSSAWEFRYASKSADISSIGLRYNAEALPQKDLGAAWYYTGERTVAS